MIAFINLFNHYLAFVWGFEVNFEVLFKVNLRIIQVKIGLVSSALGRGEDVFEVIIWLLRFISQLGVADIFLGKLVSHFAHLRVKLVQVAFQRVC